MLNNEDVKTSVFKDFLALIKIGIINSNIITASNGDVASVTSTTA
jgi:heme O synthase-like polyprenyltransferase